MRIYGQYLDTAITFEYTLPTEAEFAARISDILRGYPYLIWEENGAILGYAYAHRAQERQAYQWNAELSVYVEKNCLSHGIGKRLYRALFALLKLQGIRTVYGVVTVPNEKNEGLHRALGFRLIGIYRHAGYKCGAWRDVAWFEKVLAPYAPDPQPPLPITALPEAVISDILQAASQI